MTTSTSSPPSSTSFTPAVGAHFPTRDELVDAVTQWIYTSGLSKKVSRNDKNRYHIHCRAASEHSCPFHLAAHPAHTSTGTGGWTIKTYVPHTCPASAHQGYKLARSAKLLARRHRELIRERPGITAKELQEFEREKGVELPYKQAWRALNRGRKNLAREAEDGGDGEEEHEPEDTTMSALDETTLDPRLSGADVPMQDTSGTGQEQADQVGSPDADVQDAAAMSEKFKSMPPKRYTLTFFVPPSHLTVCKKAVFEAGAGRVGNYSQVSFELSGICQFMPTEGATPHTGEVGKLEVGSETRVEVLCPGEDVAREAVKKLKEAHPYEEVLYFVHLLEDF